MFGRRRKKKDGQGADDTAETPGAGGSEVDFAGRPEDPPDPEKDADRHRANGPWDFTEQVPDAQRMDLGSVRIPVGSGIEVQVNVAQQQNRIIGVTLRTQGSALQVQPFAAPKSSGVWEEMCAELRSQVTSQGGKVEDFEGTFGPELRAVVPVTGKKDDEGRQMGERVRFIGVDGPRWVLHGVIRGEGASKAEAMAEVEELFQQIVVARGDTPMPPREMLPIVVPQEIQQQMAQSAARRNRAESDGQAPAGGGQAGDGGEAGGRSAS
ncbi:DUF3710 domain-containing protein [Streptomonospora salina]|uniref:DUF3710 domain-containing protein n=1 Tax=Streptomonospora salina TaxID=104205 RepID=A0A841EDQ6_9ACTN|nr:DUF3710 domain-containing protein [Streptomonospora salina]MBB6001265.1 hypothetical protein [Streptomonospora salina]